MSRSIVLFAVAFAIGAAVALGVRSALYRPYSMASAPPAAPASVASPAVEPPSAPSAPAAQATANTICPVCGMEVDPGLPTAQYEGRTIGFGCEVCPARFAAEPSRYGPSALQNRKAE